MPGRMDGMSRAVIFDIQRFSVHDGPGIRTTVFFKGCHNHCSWCHNPESLSSRLQILRYPERCIGCGRCGEVCALRKEELQGLPPRAELCIGCGKCAAVCPASALVPCGREFTAEELFARIREDAIYYEESGGGVTFSGGEPVLAGGFLTEILQKCKAANIHTAVQTAGNLPFQRLEPLLGWVDLWMIDVKVLDPILFAQHVGSHPELVLENIRRLTEMGKRVIAHTPVVGGVNDTVEAIGQIASALAEFSGLAGYELLPYHSYGLSKTERLTGKTPESDFYTPSAEAMAVLREAARGFRKS